MHATTKETGEVVPGPAMREFARTFLTPSPVLIADDEREVLATASEEAWVPHDGRQLHVFAWGDTGPAVLLVHGFGGSVGQLTPLVAPLRRIGLRVVAHEAPAHGASEGALAHVPSMAEAVAAVAARYAPVHAAIGHSAGATAIARAVQHGLELGRAAFIAPGTSPRRWVSRFAAGAGVPSDDEASLIRCVEEIAGAALAALELDAIAPALRLPVLAVYDLDDPLARAEDVRRAIRAMPRVRAIETAGLGHFRILRAPAVVRQVAAFLAEEDVVGERAVAPG